MTDTPQPPDPKTTPIRDTGSEALLQAAGRLIRTEGRLLVAILFVLALSEGVLRMQYPALTNLVYAKDMTGGHPIQLTPEGYRVGKTPKPQTNTPRLLGLGDSTTFGTGVAAEQTWPDVLEQGLKETLSARNGGAEGAEMREFAKGLQQVWTETEKPDISVLLVTANMISFTDFRWHNTPRDPRQRIARLQSSRDTTGLARDLRDLVQSSALWKAISLNVSFAKFALGLNSHRVDPDKPLSPLMAYGWIQPDMQSEPGLRMWQRFDDSLIALHAEAKAQGICLIVGFLPPRFMLSDHWRDNLKAVPKDRLTVNPEDRLRTMTARLDVPFVPTADALRAARAELGPTVPLYIPGDYTHLDATGHTVIADSLAQTVARVLASPDACRHQTVP